MNERVQEIVYKVCAQVDWDAAVDAGAYQGSADDARDGFIHLSTWQQLPKTLEKHFRGQADLILIAFDAVSLGPGLKWEPSRGGALFPHYYGDLDPAREAGRWPLALDADGVPRLPADTETGGQV